MLKRNCYYNILKLSALLIACGAVVGLLGGCKEKDPAENLSLRVKLSPAHAQRALAAPAEGTSLTIDQYSSVLLRFWNEEGTEAVWPFSMTFEQGTADMDKLTSATGLAIDVSPKAKKITADCNFKGAPSNEIYSYQGKTLKELPYRAGLTTIDRSESYFQANGCNALLAPKPAVARIEVFGSLVPVKNAKGKTDYSDITITGIYVNNFIKDADAPTRLKRTPNDYDKPSGVWKDHPEAMHNLEAGLGAAIEAEAGKPKTKCDTYYLFPDKAATPTEIDHVIVRLSYKLKGVQKDNRFLTIAKYKDPHGTNLKTFAAGYVYKLNLSSLGELFVTPEEGDVVDPTDDRPEETHKEITGNVDVAPWDDENIDIEL